MTLALVLLALACGWLVIAAIVLSIVGGHATMALICAVTAVLIMIFIAAEDEIHGR